MNLTLECERAGDGRWITECVQLPGAVPCGSAREVAIAEAAALVQLTQDDL